MDKPPDYDDLYQEACTSALWQPALLELCGLCGSGCPVPVCLVSCGHRFCLSCLEGFWQQLPNCEKSCPTCTLPGECQASQRQCNVCPAYQPRSCLTCGQSHMMEEESGGHLICDMAGEEAGGARRCPEHRDRTVEMYCSKCKVCICTLCPILGIHKGHIVTLIQQEAMHKKNLMNRCLEQLDQKRINVLGNIQNIEQAATELKTHNLECKDSMTLKFTEVRLLLEEEETIAKKYIDDKTKMVLWAYESQTETCQDQMKAIDKVACKIRGIQLQPDAIQLIQDYTASEKEIRASMAPAEQWHPVPVTFDQMENYYGSFTEFFKSYLKEPLTRRLKKDTFSGLGGRAAQTPGTLIKTRSFVDRLLFLKHARSPTLDANTMHPKLRLSEDLLTVSCAWLGRFNSRHPPRFDKLMQILSRDCYFSGTHYWEVDVLQAGQGWWIGVTYQSIQRKGDSELSRLGWTSGSWCIKRFDDEYWAFHKGERKAIHLNTPPEKVGVFLDYESGVLSFFDVVAGMVHLHTFRCRFTEPLHPALRLWDGSVTICRLT